MARQVGYLLPILVLMALLNPAFSHSGETVLGYWPGGGAITLESLCMGISSAVMMGACIVWFNCCNTVVTSDKVMYLFGRLIPSLSLLLSMTLRFVPRFKHFLQGVMQAQKALHKPRNRREKLRQAMTAFSATVSWAMEQSIVTADSMKGGGYGAAGRTSFSIYRFEKRDGFAMFVVVMLSVGAMVPCITGHLAWSYLPAFAGVLLGPVQAFAYGCFAALCFLPLIIDFAEDHKWNSLRSKI
jgi:energy-coupling factor transport system permease protein